MEITRREGLALAMGMTVTACGGSGGSRPSPLAASPQTPAPASSGTPSLNALARQKGMRFGSTLSSGGANAGSFRNPNYARMLETDCAILVPENEMKWQSIRPNATDYDFRDFDDMLGYAESKGMAMRGHTLLWHRPRWMPAWAESYNFGARPIAEAERLLTNHIKTVTGRYRSRVKSFDVVNETVVEDSTLAETALSRAIGGTQTLVDLAFHTARAEMPDTQLVYNDYMSWEPNNEKHRAGVLKLLEGFKARNVPVDALGVQSHIRIDTYDPSTGTGPRAEREWRKFIDEVVGMGYGLLITEFDVNDQALAADNATRDQGVADYARAYLDLMFSYPQLKDVLVWGMCDSYSWLQSFDPVRTDGLAKRPCPYDASFDRKPLYDTIAAAFLGAPNR
jgi:endo-1,4-beta-xylanase